MRQLRRARVLVTIALTGCAHATPAPEPRASSPTLAVLDERVPGWLAQYRVPSIAVAWIDDGEIAWTRVYGDQSPGVPATQRTLYNVASLTKPVFAEVILRLVAEGRLSLDEPLAAHWVDPDLASDPRHEKLTPRLVLSHRTGFPNWRTRALQFQAEPGTVYGYSGEGYQYLRRFTSRKLGSPIDELAHHLVFDPLGMRSTSFTRQPWFDDRVAMGRGADGNFASPDFSAEGNAADLLYTTIGDYAAFLAGVMNRAGLPAAYARQRDSSHVLDDASRASCRAKLADRCAERFGMGLGWSILEYPGFTVRWHTGSDAAHKALVFYVPERRQGAVLLTNGADGFGVIIEVAALLARDTPFEAYLRSGG
jgi:CubicO group peptidase (beta-lactamase class C family)